MNNVNKNKILNCDVSGGYEPLQCDNNLCWCVDPRSGMTNSVAVPDTVVSILPCYPSLNNTLEQFGSQYLRKCENRAVGIAQAKLILRWQFPQQ